MLCYNMATDPALKLLKDHNFHVTSYVDDVVIAHDPQIPANRVIEIATSIYRRFGLTVS